MGFGHLVSTSTSVSTGLDYAMFPTLRQACTQRKLSRFSRRARADLRWLVSFKSRGVNYDILFRLPKEFDNLDTAPGPHGENDANF